MKHRILSEITKEKNRVRARAYYQDYKAKCKAVSDRNLDQTRFGGNKAVVLTRDGYKCVVCYMTNEEHLKKWGRSLTIDHKDNHGRYSDQPNNDLKNLITLCLRCHGEKDVYVRWNKLKDWRGYEIVFS